MAEPLRETDTASRLEHSAERPILRLVDGFDSLDLAYSDAQNRERGDDDGPTWLIEGLIPLGVFLFVADPGAGKSMFVQQLLHHLCYGRPLGPWQAGSVGGRRGLVVDLEGDWTLNRDRSYSITPYRDLEQDGRPDRTDHHIVYRHLLIPPTETEHWRVFRKQHDRHLAYLDRLLTDQEEAGEPLDIVVIDTLSKFAGPRPGDTNAYEHEAQVLGEINRIGLRHRCSIVVIHHTNKAGEVSGSTGLAGSATVVAKLELGPEPDQWTARRDAVLRSLKVRSAAPFVYPMAQLEDGTWAFVDDVTTDQAATAGQKRQVLDALAKHGPMSKMELLNEIGMTQSLGRVLQRLRAAGMIRSSFGRWVPVASPAVPGPTAEIATPAPAPLTKVDTDEGTDAGTAGAAGASPQVTAPAGAVDDVDQADVDQAEEQSWTSGYTMIRESLEASRMHPVARIAEAKRDEEPWTLITELMDGRHRWSSAAQLPADHLVAVLDRNGSFPSAAGSVPLAANLLHHTGPMPAGRVKQMAGLFLIKAVPWDDERIGHPLGLIAAQPGPWWVTTPHVQLLEKLGTTMPALRPVILDSWTGRGTGGLLTHFSKRVQHDRLTLTGDAYTASKVSVSKAMRALWPKHTRSPFWRPDWLISLRAESSVRHWVRGYQAVKAGATLLAMGDTDEVVFGAPPDATNLWAPEPYTVDERKYGSVKHKVVDLGAIETQSPLRFDLWANQRGLRLEQARKMRKERRADR